MERAPSLTVCRGQSEVTSRVSAILAAGYLRLRARSSRSANGSDRRPNLTPCPASNCLAIGQTRRHRCHAGAAASRSAERS